MGDCGINKLAWSYEYIYEDEKTIDLLEGNKKVRRGI